MNRHRSAPKTPLSVFITLGLAAAVATTGGVMHAFCKNQQVLTQRETDATERRTEQAKFAIQMAEVRMDQMLDPYDLKDRLRTNGSSMVSVGHGDIVDILPPASASSSTVASTDSRP